MYVSEADHRRALTLVGNVAQTTSLPEFVAVLLAGLQALGADEVVYSEITTRTWKVGPTYGYPTSPQRAGPPANLWVTEPTGHPWVRFGLQQRRYDAVRLSDLCSRDTLRGLRYYADFYRPRGVDHADYSTIAEVDGTLIGVALNRRGRDFSDAEHDVVEHLRRPLGGVWSAIRRNAALRASTGEPSPTTATTAGLTPSERRVADLVVRGASNRETAAVLGISAKAVEQHLTHVYRKLQVRSRVQLVRRLAAR